MQKITITAPTLNDAMQEVKKRFGDEAVIEKTEEVNNEIRLTITVFEGSEAIIVPSLRKKTKDNRIDNPLSAIRLVEQICKNHYLGQDFQDAWLKALAPYLVLPGINLEDSFGECLNFDQQWLRKVLNSKPIIFLGSFGCGKTQVLAKAAALFKAADRPVAIYNLDTFKASGQNMLEEYARKLEIPYVFGQEAWHRLQQQLKHHSETLNLIDSSGINLSNSKDFDWLLPYIKQQLFHTVLLIPADGCISQTNAYIDFIKNFKINSLMISKLDISISSGLPIRAAWLSETPLTMINTSASLSENLNYANSQTILSWLMRRI